MRKVFSKQRTKTVTITNGDESLDFLVSAFPAGWTKWLRQVFPKPTRFKNGKPIEVPEKDAELYDGRQNWLYLAKGLREDDCVEAEEPTGKTTPKDWAAYADAVENEFVAANFGEGDVLAIFMAIMDLSGGAQLEAIQEAAGN